MNYKRCECCGNYFLDTEETKNNIYCSPQCAQLFIRCSLCGNYYEYEENMDPDNYYCCEFFLKSYKEKRINI